MGFWQSLIQYFTKSPTQSSIDQLPTTLVAKCGHTTERAGYLSFRGENRLGRLGMCEDGTIPYCLTCLQNMSIPCGRCGQAIFIGDSVGLFTPHKNDLAIDQAHIHHEDPLEIVCCTRWGCNKPQLGYLVGNWLVPGVVRPLFEETKKDK